MQQKDAARQNTTALMDMGKETQDTSRQQFEAAMRCSQHHWEAARQISMLVGTRAKRITLQELEADKNPKQLKLVADKMLSSL